MKLYILTILFVSTFCYDTETTDADLKGKLGFAIDSAYTNNP